MAFDHVEGITMNYDENTSDRHSTCYQTVLRLQISPKEMLSNSICLCLMENQYQSGPVLISAVFVTSEGVDSPKVFTNRSFWVLK